MSKELTVQEKEELQAQLFDEFYRHVAAGGSAVDFAKAYKWNFGEMMLAFRSLPDGDKRVNSAFMDRDEFDREEIFKAIKGIAACDIRQVFDELGNIIPPRQWPDEVAMWIKSVDIRYDKEGNPTYKIQMWNKEKALEMLARAYGLFIDRVEHSGTLTLEDVIVASKKGDGDAT